ncbi:MAG: hypothetical protein CMJ19_07205 [Phycisphaeraceae bacterium]|nr:hypothetical protein [Phycisphaeraceae bacterium]
MLKKEYQSTVEEAIEVQYRLCKQSDYLRRFKFYGLLWAPFMFALFYFMTSKDDHGVVWGLAVSGTFIVIHMATYDKILRRRFKKTVLEKRGHNQPITAQYELDDQGLTFQSQGNSLTFQWQTITQMIVTDKDIEFRIKPQAIALIPCRVFDSDQEKKQWIEFAQTKIKEAEPKTPPTSL